MFDQVILQDCLKQYKEDFLVRWEDEDYKWEMLQWFKDHWDINASNFYEMFSKATEQTDNLLTSVNNFPRGMIQIYSEQEPETVRNMFKNLFDESKDLYDRFDKFIADSDDICERLSPGKQHYQRPMAISVYLWLRYPEKYCIYKYSDLRNTCLHIKNDVIPKKGEKRNNISLKISLNKAFQDVLKEDSSFISMYRELLRDEKYYKDENLVTLADDFIVYIARKLETWIGTNYHSGITEEEWKLLIKDPTVFDTRSLKIMKRMLDYGGQATCTQLAEKYGEKFSYYNFGSIDLCRRIEAKTGCPLFVDENGEKNYWTILYTGRNASKEEKGVFLWKLRKELKNALEESDLSKIPLMEEDDNVEESDKKAWWLVGNPNIWSLSFLPVGETQEYTLYNENGNKRHIFKNFTEAKEGDIVIGYESTPTKQIVSLLKVAKANDGEVIVFEKTEDLINPVDLEEIKACQELKDMEFLANPNGSFFKLSSEEYQFLLDLIREKNPRQEKARQEIYKYSKEDFLQEVYMEEYDYEALKNLVLKKKNVILQGAPGVGKTFCAKRLAYSIIGTVDESRVEFIQFHQSYSYEDFVMGYKPNEEGFELRNGIFYNFCKRAANNPDQKYFFIIDEINRGNLSKIFGELLMLIEADYRKEKATLAYTGVPFSVPENLYIIGMMNTADRSLAMIDYALRRRFSFFSMEPAFDKKGFVEYQKLLNNEQFNDLVKVIKDLNTEITNDTSLGKGFVIGHSYFCRQIGNNEEDITAWLQAVIDYDIIPTLEEYWFDSLEKVESWKKRMYGVISDS